jgi:hypothetical protein
MSKPKASKRSAHLSAVETPSTVQPDSNDSAAARRFDRYAVRSKLSAPAPERFGGWVSSLDRVRRCGRFPVGNLVAVRVTDHGDNGGKVAGLAGLEMCGSQACPVCVAKVGAKRCDELTRALTHHTTTGGGSAVFVTLTMRHNRHQALAANWNRLSEAWKAATNGAGWRLDREQFGVLGYQRTTEITHGANGWHIHIHAVLFLSETNPDPALVSALGHRMFGRWRKKLRQLGMNAPIADRGGLDIRLVTNTEDLGGYLAKFGTEVEAAFPATSEARKVALEATRSDMKKGKAKTSRTVWQILGDFFATGDLSDLRLWQEFEQAQVGRRRTSWTRVPKENGDAWAAVLAARGEVLEDEEAANEDHGGEDIAFIDAEEWKLLVMCDGEAVPRLLRAAEVAGYRGIRDVLSEFGLSCWRFRPVEQENSA